MFARLRFLPGVLALVAAVPTSAQDEPRPTMGAEDVTAEGLVFVETALERDAYFVHEPFTLRLRFGVEAAFLETRVVQLFQRELDVPAQVQAPWLEALADADAVDELSDTGGYVVLGERVVRANRLADREVAGHPYSVYELARTYVADRPGTLSLAAPLVRFAFATRFEDDFVQGRRALDQHDAFVRGTEARLEIRALPEEGRPPEFGGAIGRFTVAARAEPSRIALGEGLALTVRVQADGPTSDLTHANEPRLDDLPGFHVRGQLVVERGPHTLVARYDLVPDVAGVIDVPPIRFASFDTTPPARYVTVETQPVPLVVEAPRAEAPAAAPAPAEERSPTMLVTGTALAVLVLIALGGALLARRRSKPDLSG